MGLSVTSLSVSRSGRPVLRDVAFDLAPGGVTVLRGPNGAGKSTLLRALGGLLPMESGEVTLLGTGLRDDRDGFVEQIAYAGHLDAIKPQLTVAENLSFWAALFGSEDISRALEVFELEALADRPAHACSAGQKRRLGLARLMVARRPLWLLDEPSVSLDAPAVARLMTAIGEHCADGGMAVIATHVDLDLPQTNDLRLEPVREVARRIEADPFLAGDMT